MICNSLDIYFLHGDVHGQLCKNSGYILWLGTSRTTLNENSKNLDVFIQDQKHFEVIFCEIITLDVLL